MCVGRLAVAVGHEFDADIETGTANVANTRMALGQIGKPVANDLPDASGIDHQLFVLNDVKGRLCRGNGGYRHHRPPAPHG